MDATVSVVMTTYGGDNQSELRDCVTSLLEQERQPDEAIIVRGHDIPSELVEVITNFEMNARFFVHDIIIDEQGRGHARRVGVERATSDYIAIMDADDIAYPDRISRQLKYFNRNPSTDVVGGYIEEFETDPNEITSIRKVPLNMDKIERIAHYRCPINHPTVMFRRDAVLDVGNYREMEYGEDHELWCRLLANSKELANIPETLVKVRATGVISRRQGYKIARREVQLQRAIVQSGFYGWRIASVNLAIRIPLRFLPKWLLRYIYRNFFRQ